MQMTDDGRLLHTLKIWPEYFQAKLNGVLWHLQSTGTKKPGALE
jgi:hypothetical protein